MAMDWRPGPGDYEGMPPLVDSRGPSIPPPGRGNFPSMEAQMGGGGRAHGNYAFPGAGGGGGPLADWPAPPHGIGGFQPPMPSQGWGGGGGGMHQPPYSPDSPPHGAHGYFPVSGYPGYPPGGGMADPRMYEQQQQQQYGGQYGGGQYGGGQYGDPRGHPRMHGTPGSDDSWEEDEGHIPRRTARGYSPYPSERYLDPNAMHTPSMAGGPQYGQSHYEQSQYGGPSQYGQNQYPQAAYGPHTYGGGTAYGQSEGGGGGGGGSRISDWSMMSYPSYPGGGMDPQAQAAGYGPGAMVRAGSLGYSGRPNRRPIDWRPDFKKSGFGTFLGRRRSFSGMEGPRGILHRYLEYNRGEPPAYLDLRLPYTHLEIPTLGRPLTKEDFGRFIMEPPPSQLRIQHSKLPWYIEILSSSSAGITFLDFFSQLSAFLSQPIIQHDYYNSLLDDGDRDRIGRAWYERASKNSQDMAAGVRRIDYLMGRVMFQGLDRNRDGVWELKTARQETQPNRRAIGY